MHGLSACCTLIQHIMYSTVQLKYRWHWQMKSLSPATVSCSSPHQCSYWTDRSVRPCCDCSWLMSWTLYPDWKECK